MNPKQFLMIGGVILALLGLIGLTGVTNNIPAFNLDSGENIAHLVLGIVALAAYYLLKDPSTQKMLVIVVGVVALAAGLIGFTLPAGDEMHRNFAGLANLENPLDNLLHVVVGLWAFYAAFMGKSVMVKA